MRNKQVPRAVSAEAVVAEILNPLQEILDVRTVRGITAAVTAIAGGADLALTSIGRHLPGFAKVKHSIKRVDRLLGNAALTENLDACWGAVVAAALPKQGPVMVLVDWTGAPHGSEHWILSASLPSAGRAIRIYESVCPESQLDSAAGREAFFEALAAILPGERDIVLIADAGFRVPFLKQARARGWDYLVRMRGRTGIRLAGKPDFVNVATLFPLAVGFTAHSLGPAIVTRQSQFFCPKVVVYQARLQGRKVKSATGKTSQWSRGRYYAQMHREPWVLLTSLADTKADEIQKMYALRMTHEEAFRDLKSPRWGLAFRHCLCRNAKRLSILCFLGALAARACIAVARLAETSTLRFSLQANTERRRRVLSLFFVGRLILGQIFSRQRALLVPSLC